MSATLTKCHISRSVVFHFQTNCNQQQKYNEKIILTAICIVSLTLKSSFAWERALNLESLRLLRPKTACRSNTVKAEFAILIMVMLRSWCWWFDEQFQGLSELRISWLCHLIWYHGKLTSFYLGSNSNETRASLLRKEGEENRLDGKTFKSSFWTLSVVFFSTLI